MYVFAISERFAGRVPLLANMVEGGSTPMFDAAQLQDLGFSLVIFPGGLVRAMARLQQEYFASLKSHGWNQPFRDRMLDLGELNGVLGTSQTLEQGAAYDAANFQEPAD